MIKFCLVFIVATAVFAFILVAGGLSIWVLAHFVMWKPFSGLPWGYIRFLIALGAVFGFLFSCSDEAKDCFE